jgi:hypothetical protein
MTKQDRYRYKHRALGLCWDCGEPVVGIGLRCKKHMDKIYHATLQRKAKIRAEEIKCYACGHDLDHDVDAGHMTCFNCRQHLYTSKFKEFSVEATNGYSTG